jgi:hypothetical protein
MALSKKALWLASMLLILSMSACQSYPTPEITLPTQSPTPGESLQINYSMLHVDDNVFLVPSTLHELQTLRESGETVTMWKLAAELDRWEPIEWSASKIASIHGPEERNMQDLVVDVYSFEIGSSTFYQIWDKPLLEGDLAGQLLDATVWHTGPGFALHSKDYTIFKAFDDIYAIDDKGTIRMITSRKIEEYDYATIPKKGMGDVYRWEWAGIPACSKEDNRIFYLSSREGNFYSIWVVDLDHGTERRFGHDLVIELKGIGDGQLLAYGVEHMYSTLDAEETTEKGDWYAQDGWLCKKVNGLLLMKNNGIQIEVQSNSKYSPWTFQEDVIWLSRTGIGRGYLCINTRDQTCSVVNLIPDKTFSNRTQFLEDLTQGKMTWAEAAGKGTSIKVQ